MFDEEEENKIEAKEKTQEDSGGRERKIIPIRSIPFRDGVQGHFMSINIK